MITNSYALVFFLLAPVQPSYDILIENGIVVDGTGGPRFRANIAIRGDTIVAVGPELGGTATRIIDADGLVVAPGFIDMHTHSESRLLKDGRGASFTYQGITTQLLGESSSAGPILGKAERTVDGSEAPTSGRGGVTWRTLGDYFRLLEASGISTNVASLVGSGQVRACIVGYDDRAATDAELEAMKRLVAEAMVDGAVGLSSGLSYVPNVFASTEELIELAKVAAMNGGFYSTHLRDVPDDPLHGLNEAFRIAREADIAVEIMHLNSSARENLPAFVRAIETARAQGLDITANAYPYLRGLGGLRSRLPTWAQEGGLDALLARLKDDEARRRMQVELEERFGDMWEKIMLGSRRPAINGKNLAAIAAERGVPPAVALMDILLEEDGETHSMTLNNTEDNLRLCFQLPWVHVGSDGASVTPETADDERFHPRFFGTFPRILRRYVRGESTLSLEEAIHKMTLHGARRLGLSDRGQVAEGKKADLVVFDAASVDDPATFADPSQYATGIQYVLVNGELALDRGRHNGAKPGTILRRKVSYKATRRSHVLLSQDRLGSHRYR